MKCADVQAVLIEYVEGALGAADDMCIDIHLIQCECCRGEIAALQDFVGSVADELRDGGRPDEAIEFLERLHEVTAQPPAKRGLRRFLSPALPTSAIVALVALAIGLMMSNSAGVPLMPWQVAPVAEARTVEVSERQWAPYLRQERGLLDLDSLGLVDPPAESVQAGEG